jgi:hypothetical protein
MSKGGSQTSTQTQTLDPEVKGAFMGQLDAAKAAAAGLGERQFAGFNPMYDQGEQMALGAASGAGSQALNQAMMATQGLGGYQPERIGFDQQAVDSYFNPFQQQVVDQTLADIERQRQMASQNIGQQASAARAFGGSRQGVAEGVMAGEYGRTAAQTAAGLRSQGYQQALGLAQQQQQLNQAAGMQGAQFGLSAAQQLGNMGQVRTAADLQAAQTAMGLGGARQQFAQQQLDAARNLELERLGITQGALGLMSPTMGATQTTTTPTRTNLVAPLLGGALAGAAMFGSGGTLAGMGGISPGMGVGLGAGLGLLGSLQ